jgi:hypothetical protein
MIFPYVAVTEGSNSFTSTSIDQDFADRAGLVSIAANAVSAASTLSFIRVNFVVESLFLFDRSVLESIRLPAIGLASQLFLYLIQFLPFGVTNKLLIGWNIFFHRVSLML